METPKTSCLPRPSHDITPETKRELQLLRLRGAFGTKRFYKSYDSTKFPKHFAFGTVVEGPTEIFSGRLQGKQRRKATFAEQLLADPTVTQVWWARVGTSPVPALYWTYFTGN